MRWSRAKRAELSPRTVPSFAPVERFVREVIPDVPGGRQTITDRAGHLDLIRRAAADRDLSIKKIGGTTYFYDERFPVGGMTGWVPTLVSREALDVSMSKDMTKRMLDAANVPIPAGITVGPGQLDDALTHLRADGRPHVLKPSRGAGGRGITTGITSEEDLRTAWLVAEAEAGKNPSFVLEEQVDGIDIRAYVIGSRVAAAATRIHAHVVGDGGRSITELVAEKQAWRAQQANLRKLPIVVDLALLARQGRTVDDTPAADEVVVVNGMANVGLGGESVDVTELAHPDLMTMAVDAARAIPGLGVAGVDLLTPDITSADGAVVLEVNVQANVRIHHCPAHGRPRDVAGAIIDEMIATARHP